MLGFRPPPPLHEIGARRGGHKRLMRLNYALALYEDDSTTLDDLRESVTTLEDLERIARRVLGNAHPLIEGIEMALRGARRAREAYVRAA